MKKYYLYLNGAQQGPFDLEALKSMNINAKTHVWFEGLDNWTTVDRIPELKDFLTAAPPPFAAASMPPPAIGSSSENIPYPKQANSTARKLLIYAGVVVLILTGIFVYNKMQHEGYENTRQLEINAEEDRKANVRSNITSYITAERSAFNYSALGGISDLSISVTNGSDYLIDHVQVKLTYIKANGDVWDTRMVDFNFLNPKTKTTIKVPDTERGVNVQYEIASIHSAALGMD